ncbi:MAG: Fe-S cluster assembly protein SufD [Rhodospirillaceae bacterium]
MTWLDTLRSHGRTRFAELGLPKTRQEAWRFTSLAALERTPFRPADAASAGVAIDALPSVTASHRLVFVNGCFRAALSSAGALAEGAFAGSLADALVSHPALLEAHLGTLADDASHGPLALNTAHLTDGAVLYVPKGVRLEAPVELVLIGAGGTEPLAWHPRLLVVMAAGAEATLIEHHLSRGDGAPTFANGVSELFLDTGARLNHYKVQRENAAAFHLATVNGRLEREACYEGFLLSLGARLSRNEVRLVLAGTGAEARLSGAYLVRGEQLCDTTTVIDHARPGGASRQLFKGVIDEKGHGVFQGKVLVRPDAQKTDAHQLSRALLLSDDARIDAKPELEIHADDVKCSHGATAGDLDDDALFYLRARGIDLDGARALLIGAYVGEAIAEISSEPVREAFEGLASAWLRAGS